MRTEQTTLVDQALALFRELYRQHAGLLPANPRWQRLGRMKYRAYRRMRRRESATPALAGKETR